MKIFLHETKNPVLKIERYSKLQWEFNKYHPRAPENGIPCTKFQSGVEIRATTFVRLFSTACTGRDTMPKTTRLHRH